MQATVEELNRGIERHRKTIDKANNLIMEQELAPIKKIYVDLNMLADTRLGCLLMLADGDAETVDIYTKFNVIDLPTGKRTVVISFHKRNKPIDYLFR